jgi:hypothetical protein
MKVSKKSLQLIASGALLIIVVALGIWRYQSYTLHARQAEVAARGTGVMPFDLDKTHHVFEPMDDGGLQTVTANEPSDEEQIALIQTHLQEIAQAFQEGNFSDPAQIHGHEMPGLAELRAGAERIEITYTALPDGGQIRYRTEEAPLINAIHHWFMAQLSDHGSDASGHQ